MSDESLCRAVVHFSASCTSIWHFCLDVNCWLTRVAQHRNADATFLSWSVDNGMMVSRNRRGV